MTTTKPEPIVPFTIPDPGMTVVRDFNRYRQMAIDALTGCTLASRDTAIPLARWAIREMAALRREHSRDHPDA